jgi:hypothetical protein
MSQIFYNQDELLALKKKGTKDPNLQNMLKANDYVLNKPKDFEPSPGANAFMGATAGVLGGGALGYLAGESVGTGGDAIAMGAGYGAVGGGIALGVLGHLLGKRHRKEYRDTRKKWNAV